MNMSKRITIELPDDVYSALRHLANCTGRPIEELASEWVLRLRRPTNTQMDAVASGKAWERLRQYAGAAAGGDPHASDNARIDADLAREYLSTHENTD
jgi:hypothetical protein